MKPVEDKNFLEFLGKPLIVHQLELLKKAGLTDVVVVGGGHNLGRICTIGDEIGVKIDLCEQENLDLGMAGAVLAAEKFIGKEPVLIFSNNDAVEESAFKSLLKAADGNADSFLLCKKMDEYFPGGYVEIEGSYGGCGDGGIGGGGGGFIKNIVEKPGRGFEPGNLVNIVLHVHKNPAKLVEYLKKIDSKKDDRYEAALALMMRDGVRMKAVEYNGLWQPIKYPWHVHRVFRQFFENAVGVKGAKKMISKKAQIAKSAVINGDVIIEEGVKVLDGAVISGPCYIGSGSIVATNALVRGSHVGQNCVIGFGSEIARSYLGNDVWTHTNYIGDSVIGNNVSFGGGTVVGNLRLDEQNVIMDFDGVKVDCGSNKFGVVVGDNVRVGINASLMPGVKIGEESFVGAGIVVSENIPEKSFVRGEWKLKISANNFNAAKLRRNAKIVDNDR